MRLYQRPGDIGTPREERSWNGEALPQGTAVVLFERVNPNLFHDQDVLFADNVEYVLVLLEYNADRILPPLSHLLVVDRQLFSENQIDLALAQPGTHLLFDAANKRQEPSLLQRGEYQMSGAGDGVSFCGELSDSLARALAYLKLLYALNNRPFVVVRSVEEAYDFKVEVLLKNMLSDAEKAKFDEARQMTKAEYPKVGRLLPLVIEDPLENPACADIKKLNAKVKDMLALWARFLLVYSPGVLLGEGEQDWDSFYYNYGMDTAVEAYNSGVPIEVAMPPMPVDLDKRDVIWKV